MNLIELAGCVILDEYGRVLLVHRNNVDETYWDLPINAIKNEATAEATAVQAVAEQLGLEVELIGALGFDDIETSEKVYRCHWFQAVITAGEPQLMILDDYDDFDYFELEDMPSLALSERMLTLYPKIYSGEISLN